MSKQKTESKHLVEAKGPDTDIQPKDLLARRSQRYLLINVIAKRARDLNRGARPLLVDPAGMTVTEVALEEVREGKLTLGRKEKSRVLVSLINED